MGLRLIDAVTAARGVLNDTNPDAYRYPQIDLLDYANGALRTAVTYKPELFYTAGELLCVPNKSLQFLSFDDAYYIVDVVRIKNGDVVTRVDKQSLDAFFPRWMMAPVGPAKHWMPHSSDLRMFYIYPPAPIGQTLDVVYVRVPRPYSLTEDTGLPEVIKDAVVDYIVGMAESRDDEHVVSQRATQFMTQFVSRLKG